MKIFKFTNDLNNYLAGLRAEKKTIGFVPTMGALHAGHISLVNQSKRHADVTVVSIYVNPTQFNESSDLEKYPRPIEEDIRLLTLNDVDILFLPGNDQIYPPNQEAEFEIDLEGLDEIMEGEFRPGHFRGVAQVMDVLLTMVKPDALCMGQKDFQQVAVVRQLIRKKGHKAEMIMCPIIREMHGLARSSRNVRLSKKGRSAASIIYKTLLYCKSQRYLLDVDTTTTKCLKRLERPGFKPEYFSLIDGHTLKPVKSWSDSDFVVACTAVWTENVRLIDNLIIKKPSTL